jgi:hypothetical protein
MSAIQIITGAKRSPEEAHERRVRTKLAFAKTGISGTHEKFLARRIQLAHEYECGKFMLNSVDKDEVEDAKSNFKHAVRLQTRHFEDHICCIVNTNIACVPIVVDYVYTKTDEESLAKLNEKLKGTAFEARHTMYAVEGWRWLMIRDSAALKAGDSDLSQTNAILTMDGFLERYTLNRKD